MFTSRWLASAGAIATLVACGGSTFTDGSGGGSSGSGASAATGGASAGGSGNAAGTGAAGGGAGGFGAVSGGGGTGATGGTPSNWTACNQAGTCALVPINCCGYCQPGAPLSGYQAVHVDHVPDLHTTLCADPVPCPDCVTWEDPNHLALCREGQCTAVDLRSDPLSACSTAADCKLRWGSNCCEYCAENQDLIISYSKNKNLAAEVCGPLGGACPPCMPPKFPEYYLPTCVQGHCSWTIVGP